MPVRPSASRSRRDNYMLIVTYLGENNLSFIETSALDASNVELAFQNILTGNHNLLSTCLPLFRHHTDTFAPNRNLPYCLKQGSTRPRREERRPGCRLHHQPTCHHTPRRRPEERSMLLEKGKRKPPPSIHTRNQIPSSSSSTAFPNIPRVLKRKKKKEKKETSKCRRTICHSSASTTLLITP